MMDDTEGAEDRALRKIAATLGIPVADLFAVPANTAAAPEEVVALLKAFHAVRNPRVRRACISILEAASATRPDDAEAEGC